MENKTMEGEIPEGKYVVRGMMSGETTKIADMEEMNDRLNGSNIQNHADMQEEITYKSIADCIVSHKFIIPEGMPLWRFLANLNPHRIITIQSGIRDLTGRPPAITESLKK